MIKRRQLDGKEFDSFATRFASLPLARIWFGDYLALYLELGQQVGVYERSGRPKHERHIFTGFDWTLTDSNGETTRRSDLTEDRVMLLFTSSRVQSVARDVGNELLVCFDNECQIHTQGPAQPEWSLYETPDKNVSIENGRPILEADTFH